MMKQWPNLGGKIIDPVHTKVWSGKVATASDFTMIYGEFRG